MINTFTLNNLVKIGSPLLTSERVLLFFTHLVEAMEKYEINTLLRVSHFLAQLCHESANFTILKENLNYSANGLQKTFSKYFPTQDLALKYERNPKAIASRVYGSRMGNGDESTGEGYTYRGRGFIMITGKDMYKQVGLALGIDLISNPDLLLDYKYSALAAAYFWDSRKLNSFADSDNIKEITRKINGGYNGLEDRIKHYNHIKNILK